MASFHSFITIVTIIQMIVAVKHIRVAGFKDDISNNVIEAFNKKFNKMIYVIVCDTLYFINISAKNQTYTGKPVWVFSVSIAMSFLESSKVFATLLMTSATCFAQRRAPSSVK